MHDHPWRDHRFCRWFIYTSFRRKEEEGGGGGEGEEEAEEKHHHRRALCKTR